MSNDIFCNAKVFLSFDTILISYDCEMRGQCCLRLSPAVILQGLVLSEKTSTTSCLHLYVQFFHSQYKDSQICSQQGKPLLLI